MKSRAQWLRTTSPMIIPALRLRNARKAIPAATSDQATVMNSPWDQGKEAGISIVTPRLKSTRLMPQFSIPKAISTKNIRSGISAATKRIQSRTFGTAGFNAKAIAICPGSVIHSHHSIANRLWGFGPMAGLMKRLPLLLPEPPVSWSTQPQRSRRCRT
jgi:hypothetical protein